MDHSRSKFAHLYGMLRTAIAGGDLPAGARLPASRELAAREDVSRGTVVAVFEQLRADGFIETRHGAGTFVRSAIDAARPRAPSRGRAPPSNLHHARRFRRPSARPRGHSAPTCRMSRCSRAAPGRG